VAGVLRCALPFCFFFFFFFKVSRNFIFSEIENETKGTVIEMSPRLELEGEHEGNDDPQSQNNTNETTTPASAPQPTQTSSTPGYRGREIQHIPLRRSAVPREQRPQPDPPEEPNPNKPNLAFMTTDAAGMDLPQTISEARASDEWPEWEKVINAEDRHTVGCRWTFVRKYDETGKVARYKARLVAQGYSQQLRTTLAIGAIRDRRRST